MTDTFDKFAARAAPAIFVVLWSTGFIGTKYVIHNAEPLTYLAIRMAIVVVLMAIICAIGRPIWPKGREIGHSIVAGILVHGIYLGGTAVAISLSIPAGLSALIPGMVGSLMVLRQNYFEPGLLFDPVISFSIVTMAVVGGSDDVKGPLLGAGAFVLLSELLWANAPQLYMILVGALLILFVLFMPDGLAGRLFRRREGATARR